MKPFVCLANFLFVCASAVFLCYVCQSSAQILFKQFIGGNRLLMIKWIDGIILKRQNCHSGMTNAGIRNSFDNILLKLTLRMEWQDITILTSRQLGQVVSVTKHIFQLLKTTQLARIGSIQQALPKFKTGRVPLLNFKFVCAGLKLTILGTLLIFERLIKILDRIRGRPNFTKSWYLRLAFSLSRR